MTFSEEYHWLRRCGHGPVTSFVKTCCSLAGYNTRTWPRNWQRWL